jgi:hypothetical protein
VRLSDADPSALSGTAAEGTSPQVSRADHVHLVTAIRNQPWSANAPADGDVPTWDAGAGAWAPAAPSGGGGGGLHSDYALIRDEKAQNTSGGTFTAGAWQTRDLNTEVFDTGGHVSVASNQITLTAGTWFVRASAPGFAVNRHQLRLQNITDAGTLIVGTSMHAAQSNNVCSLATLEGRFTSLATKVLELQHRCETTLATRGLGVEGNFTTEVYAVIELWKEA